MNEIFDKAVDELGILGGIIATTFMGIAYLFYKKVNNEEKLVEQISKFADEFKEEIEELKKESEEKNDNIKDLENKLILIVFESKKLNQDLKIARRKNIRLKMEIKKWKTKKKDE